MLTSSDIILVNMQILTSK